jgi:hypothetical protein
MLNIKLIIKKRNVRNEPKINVTGSQFGFINVWSMNNEIIVTVVINSKEK